MQQKIIKCGRHSLAVIIPAKFVHALGISAGNLVRVQTHIESGKISLYFSGALQLPLTLIKSKRIETKKKKHHEA
jgi:hypothetical protein